MVSTLITRRKNPNFLKLLFLSIIFINSISTAVGRQTSSSGLNCRKSRNFKNRDKCNLSIVHIAMTLDHQMFRGTVAAVHSILSFSSCPQNIFFHFILISSEDHHYSSDPDHDILEYSNMKNIFPILKNNSKAYYFDPGIALRRMSPTRGNIRLQSPLNYARIYVADLLGPCVQRVIYLDSDVLVLDDIAILWRKNLGSRTLGSPEFCNVNLTNFFTTKFWSNEKFSAVFSRRTNPCYFNTGVMVIDLRKWRKFEYEKMIERWMEIQKEEEIYELGSMPPYLLVFAGNIAAMEQRWNVRGLGSSTSRPTTCDRLPIRDQVSLLHWSGRNKPWITLNSTKPCKVDYLWARYDLCTPYQ